MINLTGQRDQRETQQKVALRKLTKVARQRLRGVIQTKFPGSNASRHTITKTREETRILAE